MSVTNANSRLRQRREQTRRGLLSAARRVLASNGYHRAKVADIAREAGVAVGTVYLYYDTKEALFVALVEDVIRLLESRMNALEQVVMEPAALLRARSATFFRFAQQHRDLFRIVFGHGDPFHDVVRRAQASFVATVAENLRAGMAAGVFKPRDPELLAHAFVGMAVQAMHWWIRQEASSVEDVVDVLSDLVFDGLAR